MNEPRTIVFLAVKDTPIKFWRAVSAYACSDKPMNNTMKTLHAYGEFVFTDESQASAFFAIISALHGWKQEPIDVHIGENGNPWNPEALFS